MAVFLAENVDLALGCQNTIDQRFEVAGIDLLECRLDVIHFQGVEAREKRLRRGSVGVHNGHAVHG